MRLSKGAILALKGMDGETRKRVAAAIGISPVTLWRWISINDDSLTKAVAIKAIREETGLPDSEILENEPAEAGPQSK